MFPNPFFPPLAPENAQQQAFYEAMMKSSMLPFQMNPGQFLFQNYFFSECAKNMYKSFFSMPPPEDKPHESIKQEKDNTIAIDQESLPRKTDLNENSKNDVPPPIEQSIELKSFEFSEFDNMTLEEFIEKLNKLAVLNKNVVFFITSGIIKFKEALDELSPQKIMDLSKRAEIYQIYTLINHCYTCVKKTKEEFSKFLFRKSFKFIKKNLEDNKKGLMKRNIKKIYLETYFQNKNPFLDVPSVKQNYHEPETNKEVIADKKSSHSKKVNKKYLDILFSNENYKDEFINFMSDFDQFVPKENQKKICKFVEKVWGFIQKKQPECIKKIQHLPWLKSWIMNCKEMGDEILKELKEAGLLNKKRKNSN